MIALGAAIMAILPELIMEAINTAVLIAMDQIIQRRFGQISFDWLIEQLEGSPPPRGVPEIDKARNFVELIKNINLMQARMTIGASIISEKAAEAVARLSGSYIWSLGLGWLSWVALSPYLQERISAPLRKYYRKKYRTTDLTRSQVEEFYKRKVINAAKAKEFLTDLGYPDEYINYIMDNLNKEIYWDERRKAASSALTAYKYDAITEEEFDSFLKGLDFNDDEIKYLKKVKEMYDKIRKLKEGAEVKKDVTFDEKRRLLSELIKAYLEGAIPLSTFVTEAKEIGLTDEEIRYYQKIKEYHDTIKEFRRKLKEQEETSEEAIKERYRSRVTTALIRAYKEGLMTRDEFKKRLEDLGYPPKAIELLMERADLEFTLDLFADHVKAAREAFRKDLITEEEFRKILSEYIKDPEKLELIISYEIFRKLPKPKAK